MTIYDFKVKDTAHKEVSLANYKGKVLLIVNTATGCGFTPQYAGLSELYDKYRDRGFEVLDFPCNQFLNQAPGTDQELATFCQINFGTKFQTFAKIKVNGKDADPLYTWLKDNAPDESEGTPTGEIESKKNPKRSGKGKAIKWNFTKFLVDQTGNPVARYASATKPAEIEAEIVKLLNA